MSFNDRVAEFDGIGYAQPEAVTRGRGSRRQIIFEHAKYTSSIRHDESSGRRILHATTLRAVDIEPGNVRNFLIGAPHFH
jgi:hypothetical protein